MVLRGSSVWDIGVMILTGETKVLGKKATLSTKNATWARQGSNHGTVQLKTEMMSYLKENTVCVHYKSRLVTVLREIINDDFEKRV
jgi:hypothetical protein